MTDEMANLEKVAAEAAESFDKLINALKAVPGLPPAVSEATTEYANKHIDLMQALCQLQDGMKREVPALEFAPVPELPQAQS